VGWMIKMDAFVRVEEKREEGCASSRLLRWVSGGNVREAADKAREGSQQLQPSHDYVAGEMAETSCEKDGKMTG
jgi:hypothetical protein